MDTLASLLGTAVVALGLSAGTDSHCAVAASVRYARGTCTWPGATRKDALVFTKVYQDIPVRAQQTVSSALDAWYPPLRITWSDDAERTVLVRWVGGIYRQGYLALAGLPCTEMAGIMWISSEAYLEWELPYLWIIVAHEMGHILGLGHSSDPQSVMYARPSRRAVITQDDRAELAAYYGTTTERAKGYARAR